MKKVRPIHLLLSALILFALLGSEILVMFLNRIVDGRDMSQVFNWPTNWYAVIFHWVITILIWSGGALTFILWAKKKGIFHELVNFKLDSRALKVTAVGAIVAIIFSLTQGHLANLTMPQIYREYLGFRNMYGANALLVTTFQNIYYIAEFTMVVLMVALFQRTGELWFGNKFPWGSIGLVLTWGPIHFLTNPQGALFVTLWALVPGIIFILGRKSFYPVFLVSILAFII